MSEDTRQRPASKKAPARHIGGLTRDELRAFAEASGQPAYRGDQAFQWAHRQRVTHPDSMGNIPKSFREALAAHVQPGPSLKEVLKSSDGTRKLLLTTAEGHLIETVLIPMGDWTTQCVSSQVGCRLGCEFCLTARMGLQRHLGAHEIVDQVHLARTVETDLPPVRNYVFMGMGEPLDNFDEVVRACRILIDEKGLDISGRRITVSTVGIAPKIPKLGHEVPVNLALSLNASSDEQRAEIMPVNRRWSMADLKAALAAFPLPPRRRITIEYVMLGGFNDTLADARRLLRFVRGLPVKVNLIPWNPFDGAKWTRPSEQTVRGFQRILLDGSINTSIRMSKGLDIGAACGQLDAVPRVA